MDLASILRGSRPMYGGTVARERYWKRYE